MCNDKDKDEDKVVIILINSLMKCEKEKQIRSSIYLWIDI